MQCKSKSKRSGKQCNNHAVTGMEVCRMHGGGKRKGAYTGQAIEQKLLDSFDDEFINNPIAVLQKQLKLALNRQARYEKFQAIYHKEREGTGESGIELTEIKKVQSEPGTSKEMTTIHRKNDYSNELNTVARLINKITQTIEDIKNKKGDGASDKTTFVISYGGKKDDESNSKT